MCFQTNFQHYFHSYKTLIKYDLIALNVVFSLLPSSNAGLQSQSEWPPEEPHGSPLGSPRQATLEEAWLEVGEDKKLEVGVAQKQEERWEEVRYYLSGCFCPPQSS